MLFQLPRKGFTLIELLIVIAIILILIAIALPNFLEAQLRAKITRVEAEFRTLATAIEAYKADYGKYPPACQLRSKGEYRIKVIDRFVRMTTSGQVFECHNVRPLLRSGLARIDCFRYLGWEGLQLLRA